MKKTFFISRSLHILLISVYVALLFMPFSSQISKFQMAKFHLALPFPVWSISQFIPSMYNFSNEIIIKDASRTVKGPLTQMSDHFYVNHYPLRILYFQSNRQLTFKHPGDYLVKLRSTYGPDSLNTSYSIHVEPNEWTLKILDAN